MQKAERLEAVKQIIRDSRISSQEQLLSELIKKGFDVTQATLSRDLKQIKVSKVANGNEGYMYSIPGYHKDAQAEASSAVYIEDLKRGFISLSFSGNICVMKTLVGHANSVAAAIDNIEIPGIIGTVAGDDTILAVMSEKADRGRIENFFRGIA
jgi:transcriptional regulator of arginine metabolism